MTPPAKETDHACSFTNDLRIAKRSLRIVGHATSISLEEAFWRELKAIAAQRQVSMATLTAEVDLTRGSANLSSALRVFVLMQVLAQRDSFAKPEEAQAIKL